MPYMTHAHILSQNTALVLTFLPFANAPYVIFGHQEIDFHTAVLNIRFVTTR